MVTCKIFREHCIQWTQKICALSCAGSRATFSSSVNLKSQVDQLWKAYFILVLKPKRKEILEESSPQREISSYVPPLGPGKHLSEGVDEKVKSKRAHLKSGSFAGVLLVVQHGLQNLLVAPRNQTHGAQDFQYGHLRFNVLCAQTLSNHINTLRVSQDVSPTLRVVHQCLYTANERGMYSRL